MSLLGVVLAASVLASCGGSTTAPVDRVRVAALLSLTGAAAPIGREQARAMRLAVSRINADGGIKGTQLDLVIADSRSDPEHSASAMRSLITGRGAAAVMGPTLSFDAVRADPVANALKTPVLAVSNTVPGIVGRCAYACEWIWRNSLGASRTVTSNVAYLVNQRNPRTAALLHAASDLLATSESRIAGAAFRARGVRIVADVPLPAPADGTDGVAADVARALRAEPGALFLTASDGAAVAAAVRAARAQGFTGPILGGDVLNETSVVDEAGKDGAGARSGAAWFAGNDFPANTAFVRAYRGAYHETPDQFAAQAYSGVMILAQAIERGDALGGDLSLPQRRAAIQKGLAKVALTTPLGPFRFTRDHDVDQIVWLLESNGEDAHDLVQFCDPTC